MIENPEFYSKNLKLCNHRWCRSKCLRNMQRNAFTRKLNFSWHTQNFAHLRFVLWLQRCMYICVDENGGIFLITIRHLPWSGTFAKVFIKVDFASQLWLTARMEAGNFKVPLQWKNRQSNFNCKRTAFADETQWRFQFLDTLFRFRDI